jgi:hypothetical protein
VSEEGISRNKSSKSLPPVVKFNKEADTHGKSKSSNPCNLALSAGLLPHVLSKTCNSQCMISASNSIILHFPAIAVVQRQSEVISQRPPVSKEQKKYALQKAKQYKSKNPKTMVIMKETYVYKTYFMVMLLSPHSLLPNVELKNVPFSVCMCRIIWYTSNRIIYRHCRFFLFWLSVREFLS